MKPFDFVRLSEKYIQNELENVPFPVFSDGKFKNTEIMKKEKEIKLRSAIGMVTEGVGSCSVTWLNGAEGLSLKTAWWCEDELVVVDNMPRILANAMAHPFGSNTKQGNSLFPIGK